MKSQGGRKYFLPFLEPPGREILQKILIIGGKANIQSLEATMAFLNFKYQLRADLYILETDISQPALMKKDLCPILCSDKTKSRTLFKLMNCPAYHTLIKISCKTPTNLMNL
jgi:hypothetical protein